MIDLCCRDPECSACLRFFEDERRIAWVRQVIEKMYADGRMKPSTSRPILAAALPPPAQDLLPLGRSRFIPS